MTATDNVTDLLTSSPSRRIAAEVRAHIGRQGITQTELARRLHVTGVWVSRRIGAGADVDLTIEEIASMAEALGISPERLLVGWLPRLDSNQQPSGYLSALVRPPATVTHLGAWRLGRAS